MKALVQDSNTPYPLQLPVHATGKAAKGAPSAWTPVTNMGNQDEMSSTTLWPDPASTLGVAQGVNQ